MQSIDEQRQRRRARVAALLDAIGQSRLAELTGIAPAYLYQMGKAVGAQSRNVSDAKARIIEARVGLPGGWIDSEKPLPAIDKMVPGRAIEVHPIAAMPDDVRPDGEHEHEIETLEFELSAGSGKIVPTVIETHSPIVYRDSWFRRMRMKPDRAKRVRVDGDSMESTLFDGDYAILNLDDTRIVDGRVYALIYGADRFGRIKRLYRTAGGVRIVSDNPDKSRFPDELVEGELFDELAIIGRVVDKSGRGGL